MVLATKILRQMRKGISRASVQVCSSSIVPIFQINFGVPLMCSPPKATFINRFWDSLGGLPPMVLGSKALHRVGWNG